MPGTDSRRVINSRLLMMRAQALEKTSYRLELTRSQGRATLRRARECAHSEGDGCAQAYVTGWDGAADRVGRTFC
jgi:hypothetical protein